MTADGAGGFGARWLEHAPHTLTNEGLNQGDTPPLAGVDGGVESLRPVLASHEGPHARCRHGDDRGTVSSAVLLLGDRLGESRLSYADGP